MKQILLPFALLLLAPLAALHAADAPPPAQPVPAKIEIAEGAFQPNWESLRHYQCPEWFRDAKLGFWGILGPQSQAEADGWYARNMYIEDDRVYRFHLDHFGHPSQFGFKDLAVRWKAERFDPDRLMELYKKAGAKYFVALATFHDNWDNWNSKYHRWNSVNVGPQKNIVGLWAAAARKQGLRFGVSEHLERSYSWFNPKSEVEVRNGCGFHAGWVVRFGSRFNFGVVGSSPCITASSSGLCLSKPPHAADRCSTRV